MSVIREKVLKVVAPIAEKLGLEIWDVCFLKEGANKILRVLIDKDSGIKIEDCERLSRAIDGPIDELNPIEGSYLLEVSSPGIERELSRQEHFKKSLGKEVFLKLIRPDSEKRREFTGILTDFDEDTLTIDKSLKFKKDELAFIKIFAGGSI